LACGLDFEVDVDDVGARPREALRRRISAEEGGAVDVGEL
jgi:hypothetical protein